MLSPQSSFRLGWDIFIAVVLAYVAIVEPLALGFSGFRHLTRQGLPLGIINRVVDVIFICDLLLNFRTGYIDDRNQLVLEPRQTRSTPSTRRVPSRRCSSRASPRTTT